MSEENRREKIVGYIIMIVLFFTTSLILVALAKHFVAPREYITVYFPKIGELKPENPFSYQGFHVGKVVSYSENVYDGVAVKVKLSRNIDIYKGYSIFCADNGIINSAREIVLYNGPENGELVDDRNQLQGVYYLGITEILTSVGKLQSAMHSLSAALELYMRGEPNQLQFFTLVSEVTEKSVDIVDGLDTMSAFISTDFPEIIANVSDLTNKSLSVSNTMRSEIPAARASIDSMLLTLEKGFSDIEVVMASADSFLVENEDFDQSNELSSLVESLNDIQEKCEVLRVNAHNAKLILQDYE